MARQKVNMMVLQMAEAKESAMVSSKATMKALSMEIMMD